MEFTENQKNIIKFIQEGNTFNLVGLIFYLGRLGYNVRGEGNMLKIKNESFNYDNLKSHLSDCQIVWNYLERSELINVVRNVEGGSYQIHVINSDNEPIPYTKASTLLYPYWGHRFYRNIELEGFINNEFKTFEEIKFIEESNARKYEAKVNETRLEEEREGRKKTLRLTFWAIVISAVGVIVSSIINLISVGNRNVTIKNPTVFPDTVKVMNYDPPKDTINFKTLNK